MRRSASQLSLYILCDHLARCIVIIAVGFYVSFQEVYNPIYISISGINILFKKPNFQTSHFLQHPLTNYPRASTYFIMLSQRMYLAGLAACAFLATVTTSPVPTTLTERPASVSETVWAQYTGTNALNLSLFALSFPLCFLFFRSSVVGTRKA